MDAVGGETGSNTARRERCRTARDHAAREGKRLRKGVVPAVRRVSGVFEACTRIHVRQIKSEVRAREGEGAQREHTKKHIQLRRGEREWWMHLEQRRKRLRNHRPNPPAAAHHTPRRGAGRTKEHSAGERCSHETDTGNTRNTMLCRKAKPLVIIVCEVQPDSGAEHHERHNATGCSLKTEGWVGGWVAGGTLSDVAARPKLGLRAWCCWHQRESATKTRTKNASRKKKRHAQHTAKRRGHARLTSRAA